MSFFQYKWPEKDIEKLIRLVRVNPCLWNSRAEDYKNSGARENALVDISIRIGVSKEEVRKKYRTLRTQYIREIRNLKTRGNISRWTHFNALRFLSEEQDDIPDGLWDPMNSNDTKEEIKNLQDKEDTYNTDIEDDDAYMEQEFLDMADASNDMQELDSDDIDQVNVDSVAFERTESSSATDKKRRNINSDQSEDVKRVNHETTAKRKPTVLIMKAPKKIRDEHTIFGEHVANELRCLKNRKRLQNTLKCSILQAIIDVNRALNHYT